MEATVNERAPEGDRTLAAIEGRLSMPLVDAMQTQRAIRRVLPDPVDDAIVVRCIELALRAPTGSNSQSWEFVIVRDDEVKAEFGGQYARAWAAYRDGDGEDLPPEMVRVADAVQWQVDHFVEIPVIVVACLRHDGDTPPADPVAASSFYGSIYPSVQNLLLAARAFGLGASLITLPLWSPARAKAILSLPDDVLPICMVPMGWPRGRYGPTSRRPVEHVIHRDRWQGGPDI